MVTKLGLAGCEGRNCCSESALANCADRWKHSGNRLAGRRRPNRQSLPDDERPPPPQKLPIRQPHGRRKDSDMYIQYRGFSIEATSRVYSYHVINPPQGSREFTVNVQTDAFRLSPLRIQDGPGICYARLKQELDRETDEFPAETHLRITQYDIQIYIEKTYPTPVKMSAADATP
jgi:hypothetical protein